MKKKILALAFLVMVISASYWGYTRYASDKPGGIQVSGTIEATEVNLTARVPGPLEFVSAKQGDTVRKNQLVARISRNDLVAQKERDSLSVQKALAQLSDLVSGAREQEISDVRAAVSTAQVNYDKANADYQRALALRQSGAMSDADLEKAETALKLSKNQMDSARSRLSLIESGSRPDQVRAAGIELERNKAVLKASEAILDDTVINSPIDGTVVTRNYEPGEFVPAGAPVVTVANLSDMWIRVYVPTDDLPWIKLGQQVGFTVSGLSEQFTGTIMEISPKGEFTPKSIQTRQERTNIVYAVKVRIDNPNGIFKPGMPADVIIANR